MAPIGEEQLQHPEGEKPLAERQPQKPDWADTLIEGYEFQGPEAIKAGLVKEAEKAGEEVESFIDRVATISNPETRQVSVEPGLETLKQDQEATVSRELEDAAERATSALKELQAEAQPEAVQAAAGQEVESAERNAALQKLEQGKAELEAHRRELEAQKAKLEEEYHKKQEALEAEIQARRMALEAQPTAAQPEKPAEAKSTIEAQKPVETTAEPTAAEAQPAAAAEEVVKPAEAPVGAAPVLAQPEVRPAEATASEAEPAAEASTQAEAVSVEPAGEKKEASKERSVSEQIMDIKTGISEALPGLLAAASAMDFKAVKSGYRRMMLAYHADKFADPVVKGEAERLNKMMNGIDGVLKDDRLDDAARVAALLNVLNKLGTEVQIAEPPVVGENQVVEPEAVGETAAEAEPEATETAGQEKVSKTAEQVAEEVKNVRIGIAALAKELQKNEGYLTDDVVEKFKNFRNSVDDLETGGADVKNLQEMMHHFGMIMNAEMSPDAGDRLKALKEFFNENPDLAEQPLAETEEEAAARMSREAEEAFQARQQQESIIKRQEAGPKLPDLENILELLDVESTAPEVAEADLKKFFEDFAGAEYNLAVKQLDATMGQREAKIKQLLATKPESEVHKKKLQEQIACLKLANQISAVRKGQWERQKGLHTALKALELDATAILETQDDLSEVVSMLENNPNDTNLIRRKEQLEGQLNNQTDEQAGRMTWIENERKVVASMNEQIKTGLLALKGQRADLNKMPDEEEIKPMITTTSLTSPEELLQKGFGNLGGIAEKGIVGLTDGLADWMHGGSDVSIGGMGAGAVMKIMDALSWASNKALAPLDYVAEKASGVKSPAAAKGGKK